jgi:DcuC family C4-dicarboxylate transporter
LIVLTAAGLVIRGREVRMVLLSAALLLGLLAGDVASVVREFLATFSNEKFVVPICSAMGFAYVLRHSGCDTHLVRLLTAPVRRARMLVLPGVVLVGFLVNIPVISQTSTAVCLGPVVLPLLRAAGFRAATMGAALLIGASMGGELLNPGAPELLTVSAKTKKDTRELAGYIVPLLIPYVTVATLTFWFLAVRHERKSSEAPAEAPPETPTAEPINYLKALVPLVPLVLLFLAGPPFNVFHIPQRWLIPFPTTEPAIAAVGGSAAWAGEMKFDPRSGSRLIGLAMIVGVLMASLAAPRSAPAAMKEFFAGAGYGFTHIVSLIVVANAFGKGIEVAGLARLLGSAIAESSNLLVPLAALVPWAFALVCGSGMASTQSLYGFFHEPAIQHGVDPASVGAMVSVASAAGRTMSPVAAVVLMCSTLTGASPGAMFRLIAPPLILGLIAAAALRMLGAV